MTLTLIEQIAKSQTDLAERKHSPTGAMKTVAARGLRIAKQHTDMDPVAMTVARKVSSGQQISDDHVEAMAAYHAAHDGECPNGTDSTSCEDMLWGGSPGANWSSARMAAIDVSELAQVDAPMILALDEEGKGVSLEVFVRDGMGEPTTLDEERKVIWAPILRSGMLATRPGPNGEKLREPLVFVPGKAGDPRKEIGLENLLESFKGGAVQHVTIPTRHENDVLDNTGFIVDMKIVDSKKRPGQKVLVAAHDFRDPKVHEKVKLGTVANRSCGIAYDVVNTETGETHDQAIDHVALTNKPWVRGMTAYGDIQSEDDFAGREVIPMLLSEAPASVGLADASDQAWDGSASRFSDQQYARSCVLDRGTGTPKERYSLPIREPDGTVNKNAVESAAGMIYKVKGASLAQKKSAARKLVAAYRRIGEQPPDRLRSLVSASTDMSLAERKPLELADVLWGDELSLTDIESQVCSALSEFGHPDEIYPIYSVMDVTPTKALVRCNYGDDDGTRDAWVIPLEIDGTKVSLSDYSQWTPVEQQWVTDEDSDRDKQETGSILGDTQLSDTHISTPTTPLEGGPVKPTLQETLERLGLSEEQRAALTPVLSENEQLRTQLAEATKQARTDRVTNRIKELQGMGFSPGFCKRYEEIALGDDGAVAAVLNLSDESGTLAGKREYTATQIVESLIAAMPVDNSGAIALANTGNLLTSPVSDRPAVNAEEQAKVEAKLDPHAPKPPATADEWLEAAEKVAPGSTRELHLSIKKGA